MHNKSSAPGQLPVIILAAGMSDRMGFPKPFLKWDKHTTFIEKIISEYSSFEAGQIIVILNKEGYRHIQTELPYLAEYCEIVINNSTERGRFSSIKLGIEKLPGNVPCYIQNVDNPFVTAGLLDMMDDHAEPGSYVVPVFNGKGGHPVLIGQKVVDEIFALDYNDRDMKELLKKYKRIEVESSDVNILANINSVDEYNKYF